MFLRLKRKKEEEEEEEEEVIVGKGIKQDEDSRRQRSCHSI
jgi:hypothetical protein